MYKKDVIYILFILFLPVIIKEKNKTPGTIPVERR